MGFQRFFAARFKLSISCDGFGWLAFWMSVVCMGIHGIERRAESVVTTVFVQCRDQIPVEMKIVGSFSPGETQHCKRLAGME